MQNISKTNEFSEKFRKFIFQNLDLLTGLFDHGIDTKGSFQVMFFNNCIDENQNKVHFEEGSSEHPSPPLVVIQKIIRFGRVTLPLPSRRRTVRLLLNLLPAF